MSRSHHEFKKTLPRSASLESIFTASTTQNLIHQHANIIEKDDVNYINSLSFKSYRLITGKVTNFAKEAMVLIGYYGLDKKSEEVLLLDPKGKALRDYYKLFCLNYVASKDHYSYFYKPSRDFQQKRTHRLLSSIFSFINSIFNNSDIQKVIANSCLDTSLDKLDGKDESGKRVILPIIPIEKFLDKNSGECRHKALLVAFILSSLIRDRLLLPGNVYLHSDFTSYQGNPESGHVWVVYRFFDGKNRVVFSIDTSLYSTYIDISGVKKPILSELYGEKAANALIEKYKTKVKPISHKAELVIPDEKKPAMRVK